MRRGFHGMNVEMVGAWMIWIARQYGFKDRDDLQRAFRRRLIEIPQLPRPKVHQAFRVERGGIEVVWIVLRQLAHGLCIIASQLLEIGRFFVGITHGQRFHISALALGCVSGELARLLYGLIGELLPRRVDVDIVIGA